MKKVSLKSFIRIDGTGSVVPGSNIFRKVMPKVGKWREINTNLCCNPAIIVLPSFLAIYDVNIPCSVGTEIPYYFNGTETYPILGDSVFYDEAGTLPVEDGYINFFPVWTQIENGIVISSGDCGR